MHPVRQFRIVRAEEAGDVKSLLRRVLPEAMERVGFLELLRRCTGTGRAAVLRYHSVSDLTEDNASYRCPTIAVSPGVFERQMRYLNDHYRVLSLDELVELQVAGKPFPKRAAAITFDDGYKDNFVHALPVLSGLGLPATVFVTTDSVGDGWRFWVSRVRGILHASRVDRLEVAELGSYSLASPHERDQSIDSLTERLCRETAERRDGLLEQVAEAAGISAPTPASREWMMSWDELRAMEAAGVQIGAHTLSHPILTSLPIEQASAEIAGSREILKRELGTAVSHFAYPNGPGVAANHDAAIVAAVEAAGFSSASTSLNGPFFASASRFRMQRIPISDWSRPSDFGFALERDRIPLMGYRSRA